MTPERQIRFWLLGLAILLVAVFFLRSILLPFAAGMAVAYLLDPVCDKLERWGLSRLLATIVVTLLFALLVALALLLIVPPLVNQTSNLLANLPNYVDSLRIWLQEVVGRLQARVDIATLEEIQKAVIGSSKDLATWITKALASLLSGGAAVANLISLLLVTPVVAFYLLRDWDRIVERIDGWLPRQHAATIRELAGEVDEILAGFIRGQGAVCLLLGAFYAVGLTLSGLDFGLVIGLIAGLLSFIPFVGSITGLVASVGLAFVQFDDWLRIAIVAIIFFVGQAIEGNLLTPKLVGDRVRLHPVWVIFALLAGGALFGFLGVLLAVPVTAVVGVAVRFALKRYLGSGYYHGPVQAGREENGKQGEKEDTAP